MAGSRLIDTYLSELRKNLAGRSDLEDVLAEVEDHLHEVAAGHVRCGMDERTAERHALGQFGSTELVTRAFVESSRRGVSAPTRTTRLAGMAGIVGGATMIPLFGLASISDLDVGGTTTWFAPLATTAGLLALAGIVGLHLRHRAL